MAIVLFAKKLPDGSGDIVHAVKVAAFIKQLLDVKKSKQKVILVVEDTEGLEFIKTCAKNFNPSIIVQTLSEFKDDKEADKDKIDPMDCVIEVAGGAKYWFTEFGEEVENDQIFSLELPEYGDGAAGFTQKNLLGGFDAKGVIPSVPLLEATRDEHTLSQKAGEVFDNLPEAIKKQLTPQKGSYQQYCKSRDFAYQYSHDKEFFSLENDDKTEFSAAQIFFDEHISLNAASNKSQDVLCIGESAATKIDAINTVKNRLIANGYTKISFINTNTGNKEEPIKEEVLYEAPKGSAGKEYRVIYTPKVDFAVMAKLPLLATHMAGITGDQSLVEAMSAGKLVSYEMRAHKGNFITGYLKKVKEKTEDPAIRELAQALFMYSPNIKNPVAKYNPEKLAKLLANQEAVAALKKINHELVAESKYFAELEDLLVRNVKDLVITQERKKPAETNPKQSEPAQDDSQQRRQQIIESANSNLEILFDNLRAKIGEIDQHPLAQAYTEAVNLLTNLDKAKTNYLTELADLKIPLLQANRNFEAKCAELIREAKPVLESDLDWGDLLSNFFKSIANAIIRATSTGKPSFFNLERSKSALAVEEELEEKLQSDGENNQALG